VQDEDGEKRRLRAKIMAFNRRKDAVALSGDGKNILEEGMPLKRSMKGNTLTGKSSFLKRGGL
jgi:hypothetical protein